jgi:hypothetical protein
VLAEGFGLGCCRGALIYRGDNRGQLLGSVADGLVISPHAGGELLDTQQAVHDGIQELLLGLRMFEEPVMQKAADPMQFISAIWNRPV